VATSQPESSKEFIYHLLSEDPLEVALSNRHWRGIESIGRWVNERLHYTLSLSTLLYLSFKELFAERQRGFPLVLEITLRQIYFTGVQALRIVSLAALALGTIVIVQTGSQMGFLGGVQHLLNILVLVILREVGPLLTAFIVIGRSGTAIATELGNMIVAHELEAIAAMGINPVYFIVTPRIVGVTLAVICLNIYFAIVALVGGFVVSKLILPLTFQAYLRELIDSLTVSDLVFGLLKSLIFGLLIALTCTYHGLTVRFSTIEVPQVATRGVVSAILSCVIFSVLLTLLFYL
jgi:phospholipid/cholesterol/gamma-HCH transport system permease protein